MQPPGPGLQCRLDGKFAANVTAAYSTGAIAWRNASKNSAEAEMWLNETLASGMVPYYHFIGQRPVSVKIGVGRRLGLITSAGREA